MESAPGGHSRLIHLDNAVEVAGGVVGTDPYGRWGPVLRWMVVILEAPVRGVNWRPFNKRDVVVADLTRTQEFYREGPFPAVVADRRKMVIVTTIKENGLDHFLRWMAD
jgi:hypothetical protein